MVCLPLMSLLPPAGPASPFSLVSTHSPFELATVRQVPVRRQLRCAPPRLRAGLAPYTCRSPRAAALPLPPPAACRTCVSSVISTGSDSLSRVWTVCRLPPAPAVPSGSPAGWWGRATPEMHPILQRRCRAQQRSTAHLSCWSSRVPLAVFHHSRVAKVFHCRHRLAQPPCVLRAGRFKGFSAPGLSPAHYRGLGRRHPRPVRISGTPPAPRHSCK